MRLLIITRFSGCGNETFPTPKSIRKLLYLANERIVKKWTMPIPNWALILNQLVIRFEDRIGM